MGLELKWVGAESLDKVAEARLEAYGERSGGGADYQKWLEVDDRAKNGDYLVAFDGPRPVGTATSLAMNMWIRGVHLPCQGVAWVGTSRTERRSSHRFGGKGVASQILEESVRMGRERHDVVSALQPFRASFYEHFGYGVVERRSDWMMPMSVMPGGSTDGLRFFRADDEAEVVACMERAKRTGQCDVDRSGGRWKRIIKNWSEGWTIVDRPSDAGPVHGYFHFRSNHDTTINGDVIDVREMVFDDTPTLMRQLRFMATLRDQYAAVRLTQPIDVPLNLLLRESQLARAGSNYPVATARIHTHTMLRVLDHKRLLEALPWPSWAKGTTVVGVQESEGKLVRFSIDVEGGHATVTPCTKGPQAAISDSTWAQIVTGELTATRAMELKLIAAENMECLSLLDALSKGPSPYCREDF
jgi:predicted acetyltransferase